MDISIRPYAAIAAAAFCAVALITPVLAGDATPGKDDTDSKVSVSTPDIALTPEEKAEKEGRRACKADICGAFRNKREAGGDIACTVVKSWRKEQLSKLVGKMKVSWPYGPVRCTSDVKLKRADLIKAMTEDKFELQLDQHSVVCKVDQDKDAPTDITFDFSPKVSFEKGKATKAKINWGKVTAPTLVKGALWTATAADNTVNVLSSTLVDDINDFIGKKCDEVKEDWADK
ncbi:MAG: hypothetical protein IKE66_05915 [Hyphomicrobium sp.]|nr:hypothetical protein [Hyphomicrobium sp.]